MTRHAEASLQIVAVVGLLGAAHAGCTVGPIQCYVDSLTDRILGNNVNPSGSLSQEYCAQLCADKGLPLAGVEFGIECYCGAAVKVNATKAANSDCSMECSYENATEKCGSSFRIGVFGYQCSGSKVEPPTPIPLPPMLVNPCLGNTTFSKMPFCDATLSIDERVEDALSRMSQQEKFGILDSGGAPVASLGLNGYNWWSEASTGVASGRYTETTKFAFPITTGMSFNRTLWTVTGRQIGREARAMMNAGNGLSTFWAPVINLAREPRWGRNIETPGEDPYHSGEYATNFVKGMEEAPEDPYHIQASACCKHYVANSMDGSNEDGVHHDRNHYDANITQQDLVDSYMIPFQACVEKGKVSGLMCSYNSVNGVPSCANDWLLGDVARGEWQFDGYVTSDCDADNDVVFSHHYTDIPEQGVQDVLRAGTDVDCGSFVGTYIANATAKGYVTQDDVDTVIRRQLRVRFRLSHFDPIGPLQSIPTSTICSNDAIELSMDGPVQSAALLKNDGKTLPLNAADVGTVAVIGPTANLSESDAGYYGPHDVCGGNFWTLVDAVETKAAKVVTMLGVPNVLSNDMSSIPAATAMAAAADSVVLAVGTDLSWAAEGHDATSITFTDAQIALIGNVSAAAKKPVTLVLFTATPLDLTDQLANPKIGAILHVGQPSVTILGVSKLLYGEVSPAGRTVQTFYDRSYADQISIFDFNMRPGPSVFPRPDCGKPAAECPLGTNPGRTHRFFTGKPVIPFGYGLSYTTFAYGLQSGPTSPVSLGPVSELIKQTHAAGRMFPAMSTVEAAAPLVTYAVNVTNTGSMDADDVVLGFVEPPGAGKGGTPLQTLFGFERVHVKAGETVSVYLYPALTDFTQVNELGERFVVPGTYKVRFGVAETAKHGMGFIEHSFQTY